MKCCQSKILVAFVTFIFGVSAFHLSSKIDFSVIFSWQNELLKKKVSPPASKPDVRFVKFKQKNGEIYAEFEVTNVSAENVYYFSYGKQSYPSPEIKRNGKPVMDYLLKCSSGMEAQLLSPSEKVTFFVPEIEFTQTTEKATRIESTQFGFPFHIGAELSREIVWTEEIEFSK